MLKSNTKIKKKLLETLIFVTDNWLVNLAFIVGFLIHHNMYKFIDHKCWLLQSTVKHDYFEPRGNIERARSA